MFHGINIILLLARFLRLCHFQQKLGIITRTLLVASGNLGHYFMARGNSVFQLTLPLSLLAPSRAHEARSASSPGLAACVLAGCPLCVLDARRQAQISETRHPQPASLLTRRNSALAPAQVLAVIFLAAGSMTHLVFGPHAVEFATLGRAFQSCFNMLVRI